MNFTICTSFLNGESDFVAQDASICHYFSSASTLSLVILVNEIDDRDEFKRKLAARLETFKPIRPIEIADITDKMGKVQLKLNLQTSVEPDIVLAEAKTAYENHKGTIRRSYQTPA